ncbi:M48 family metallopeptidase [Deinococcus sp. RIT780]|jgi:predicted metal-dependent hydrolase|uniref:M48 family metallopeptidase n=1 Tax=Deinococcus sp. RIT780 TaxID=2870472 RepID=UPI001C8A36CE|nr:SprT family zinc-dependent metalloprotease [Deinococcus sp. RIT780]MBX8463678.1 M48 family metallopeptidase [Deinococcus sp. RIT780]
MTAGTLSLDAPHYIQVGDLPVEVVRKNIKNIHLAVYPPDGRVRVATPALVNDDAIRLFTIARLPWIRRQQQQFRQQERQSPREYVSGETHYFQGRRYRLRVTERPGPAQVQVKGKTALHMSVPAGSTRDQREAVMTEWYRSELKALIPALIERWSDVLGVPAPDWAVKHMARKWGSCNIQARRVWLNLELAKQSIQNVEYVIVHELAHLQERHHNDRFRAILDQHLPGWPGIRADLNRLPLAIY